MNRRVYRTGRRIYGWLARCLYRFDVSGKAHIPSSGACVICANHISWHDPLALAIQCDRLIHFMGKQELFRWKPVARLMNAIGVFPVARGERDMTAIRYSIERLKAGDVLGIFPQGSRFPQATNHEVKGGVALAALRTGAPVIPVRLIGPYRIGRRVTVRIGAPVPLDDLYGSIDRATMREAEDRIRRALWPEDEQN